MRFFDGEKLVPEKEFVFKKGQKVILTVLKNDIPEKSNDSTIMYDTAMASGSFDYLFVEGEEEYSIKDCKEKYK